MAALLQGVRGTPLPLSAGPTRRSREWLLSVYGESGVDLGPAVRSSLAVHRAPPRARASHASYAGRSCRYTACRPGSGARRVSRRGAARWAVISSHPTRQPSARASACQARRAAPSAAELATSSDRRRRRRRRPSPAGSAGVGRRAAGRVDGVDRRRPSSASAAPSPSSAPPPRARTLACRIVIGQAVRGARRACEPAA